MKKLIILGMAMGAMLDPGMASGMKWQIKQDLQNALTYRQELNFVLQSVWPGLKPDNTGDIEDPKLDQILKEDEPSQLAAWLQGKLVEDLYIACKYCGHRSQFPLLLCCVMNDATNCLNFLIESGQDPEEPGYYWDCMSLAVFLGKWKTVKLLEGKGINKLNNPYVCRAAARAHRNELLADFIAHKDQNPYWKDCLQDGTEGAVWGNNFEALRLFISLGADINARDEHGDTPLHYAVQKGFFKMVELLIALGADINAENWKDRRPLHIALENYSYKIAELLIAKGADVNVEDKYGRMPLQIVLKNIHDIRRRSRATDGQDRTPLALKNAYKILECLILKGADVNARVLYGDTPLHFALQNGLYEIGELLIAKGADVNARDDDGRTPLDLGGWDYHEWKLHNWENYKGQALLHFAAKNDLGKVGELLLLKGAGVNVEDKYGQTPLHIALKNDSIKMGKLLIALGADVSVSKYGQTPLHIAAKNDSIKIGKFLIAKGADINARDEHGDTPLHFAAENDAIKMGELLIAKGADINAKNVNDMTALLLSAIYGNDNLTNILIGAGAQSGVPQWDSLSLEEKKEKLSELQAEAQKIISAYSAPSNPPAHSAHSDYSDDLPDDL